MQNMQSNYLSPYQQLVTYDYNSGIYQGEYFKNQRQGKGVFYWFSGQIYIGEWSKDTIEGQGTLYFPYGGNFVGFFLNNKAEGAGILTFFDGSRIAGMWKHGRLNGQFVRSGTEVGEWIVLQSDAYYSINKQGNNYRYALGGGLQNGLKQQAQQIYENIKSQIDTPYYRQMTERVGEERQTQSNPLRNNLNGSQLSIKLTPSSPNEQQMGLNEVDKYKIRVQQLDEDIFYHGILRGSRPDGMGIMFNMEGRFSVRGRFANTKLNGPGRVELENGEIYDGVFRNGVISQGFYYNTRFNSYISGIFNGENELRLDLKGKGYPYKLALENKQKVFPRFMSYKNTSEELFFLVQSDIKLLKVLYTSKYNISNESLPTTDRKHSREDKGQERTYKQEQNIRESLQDRQNLDYLPDEFDAAFEQFIENQPLDTNQTAVLSKEYYSRNFEELNEDEKDNNRNSMSFREGMGLKEKINQIDQENFNKKIKMTSVQSENFFKAKESIKKETFQKKQQKNGTRGYLDSSIMHKLDMDSLRESTTDHLSRMKLVSEQIDKENTMNKRAELPRPSQSTSESFEQSEFYLNKARLLKQNIRLQEFLVNLETKTSNVNPNDESQVFSSNISLEQEDSQSPLSNHKKPQKLKTKSYSVAITQKDMFTPKLSDHFKVQAHHNISNTNSTNRNRNNKIIDLQIALNSSGGTGSSQDRLSQAAIAANEANSQPEQ